MRFSHTGIGFLVCSRGVSMRGWQTALGFAAKSQESWMQIPFLCLSRFAGHCCVLATGAALQLVMTQYPQSLKLFFLFFWAFKNAAVLLPSLGENLWFNISLSAFGAGLLLP